MQNKTIAELGEALRKGEFTSVELTRHYLERIARLDPQLNSFISLAADTALEAGRERDGFSEVAGVSGDGFGVIFAPLEAPLVTLSDMNVYKWADKLTFDKGHIYSFALNNYWFTNFPAAQGGGFSWRYRLQAFPGAFDSAAAARFAHAARRPLPGCVIPLAGKGGAE